MSAPDFDRLEDLFLEVSELPPERRESVLEKRCGGDAELRAEIEKLLAVEARAKSAFPDSDSGPGALPERVGPYRVMRPIGRGGMGTVYLAEQERPRRAVALKILRQDALSESAKRRFDHEIATLGRLQHDGIAQIFDAGTFETAYGVQPYFAMELVAGKPLLSHAAAEALPPDQRLELFARICDGVQHAHQKGIIHRDLKPANILITPLGQPKVLDFGIAKATDADLQSTSLLTDANQLVGTLAYMSPEQAGGASADLDTRSDVYALGVVLYELLSGRLPYPLDDVPVHEAIRVVCEQQPLALHDTARRVDGELETIVAKALEKEAPRRYQSAAELAADVRRYLRNEPILARRPSTFYQLRKFTARNRALVAGAASTAAALVAGVVGFASQAAEATSKSKDLESALGREREALASETLAKLEAEGEKRRALSVSGIPRLEQLRQEANDVLWPRRPRLAEPMRFWLERAHALLAELPTYRAELEAQRASAAPAADGAPDFPDYRSRWTHDSIQAVVRELDALARGEDTLIAEMEARLEFALAIEEQTVEAYAEDWREARRAVAASDLYGGLELAAQIGLVPLGPDPNSGLWEFLHVETGERPRRDPQSGVLLPTEATGVVLVLVPGGTSWIGSQNQEPDGPNYDPDPKPSQEPPREVTLPPFFLSKYELTQGQWERLTGENPSYFQGHQPDLLQTLSLQHPLEQASPRSVARTLRRYDLAVPTQAQWESAARARTSTPWWSGARKESLDGAANIADGTWALAVQGPSLSEPWVDGFVVHAPVGSFLANAFGLHDVVGNVWEMCAVEPEDAEAFYVGRGGSYAVPAENGRMTVPFPIGRDEREPGVGVRPARALSD